MASWTRGLLSPGGCRLISGTKFAIPLPKDIPCIAPSGTLWDFLMVGLGLGALYDRSEGLNLVFRVTCF